MTKKELRQQLKHLRANKPGRARAVPGPSLPGKNPNAPLGSSANPIPVPKTPLRNPGKQGVIDEFGKPVDPEGGPWYSPQGYPIDVNGNRIADTRPKGNPKQGVIDENGIPVDKTAGPWFTPMGVEIDAEGKPVQRESIATPLNNQALKPGNYDANGNRVAGGTPIRGQGPNYLHGSGLSSAQRSAVRRYGRTTPGGGVKAASESFGDLNPEQKAALKKGYKAYLKSYQKRQDRQSA